MKKNVFFLSIAVVFFLCSFYFVSGKNIILFDNKEIQKQEAKGCNIFEEKNVQGSFVLYDKASAKIYYCNEDRIFEGKIPASTFKIANALNALENKIVTDENEVLAWDGEERNFVSWNQDTSLMTGMKNSTVWFYQEIARKTGEAKMQAFVSLLSYGNENIGGGIDRFWLDGDLRISPVEQIAFLNQLYQRKLPISKKSQNVVINLIELEKGDDWALYGKTGLGELNKPKGPLGWLVGFSVYKGLSYIYAMNVDLDGNSPILRLEIIKKLLADNNAMPKRN